MRSCVGSVMSFAGWLLISPPGVPDENGHWDGDFDEKAPPERWESLKAFRTREGCDKFLRRERAKGNAPGTYALLMNCVEAGDFHGKK
jgi:hypothetical protein